MATYAELKAQAEQLLVQAEELRRQELSLVIAGIKEKIIQYGITAKDLGFTDVSSRTRRSGSGHSASTAKYIGPAGETWTGLGRQPKWMKDALAEGKQKDHFAA